MTVRTFSLTIVSALTMSTLPMGVNTVLARQGATPARIAPGTPEITRRLMHTTEVGRKSEHFKRIMGPKTIQDGRGTGTLTAVVGERSPTVNGLGQVVFFWHNKTYIGLSANYETPAVLSLTARAAGTFIIKYAHYGPKDRPWHPSLPSTKVIYGWSGHMLISDGGPPTGPGKAPKVMFTP